MPGSVFTLSWRLRSRTILKDENSRRFFKRLAIANVVAVVLIVVLYVVGVAPNPPEIRQDQTPQFLSAVSFTLASANFMVISLYYAIRFWRR